MTGPFSVRSLIREVSELIQEFYEAASAGFPIISAAAPTPSTASPTTPEILLGKLRVLKTRTTGIRSSESRVARGERKSWDVLYTDTEI